MNGREDDVELPEWVNKGTAQTIPIRDYIDRRLDDMQAMQLDSIKSDLIKLQAIDAMPRAEWDAKHILLQKELETARDALATELALKFEAVEKELKAIRNDFSGAFSTSKAIMVMLTVFTGLMLATLTALLTHLSNM